MAAAPVAGFIGSPGSGALMQLNGMLDLRGWQWHLEVLADFKLIKFKSELTGLLGVRENDGGDIAAIGLKG